MPVVSADDDTCNTDRSCDASSKCAYKVTSMVSRHEHTCALLANGQIKCWGLNNFGQLGLGDTNNRGDVAGEMGASLPTVNLGTGRTATSVAVGGQHTCAILDTGQVKCWGWNSTGQLGLGDANPRGNAAGQMGDALPTVNLGTGLTAKALAAGFSHTCALLSTNQVKCWGFNGSGNLGLGNTTNKGTASTDMGDNLPGVGLGTGRTVKQIAAGDGITCALLDNNTIKCWGFNGDGELGLGDLNNRGDQSGELGDALPAISLGTGRTGAAVVAGETNVCALLDNGQVKCWGFNADGELGIGNIVDHGGGPNQMGDNLPAVDLGTGRTATQIAIGFGSHICARLDNSTAKCWGANSVGQLGQGSTATKGDNAGEMGDNLPPINLPSSLLVSGIAAGSSSSCALLSNGEVKCWGINSEGELGLGDNLNRGTSPAQLGTALPFVDLGP
jgi:hypothetical protein